MKAPFALLASCALIGATQATPQTDLEPYAALKARSIGPAGMSGRVTSICGVESNPETLYVGTATGGLWKTTDAGLTWTTLFDDQPVPSIGAVTVVQASPDVIWVGTGEGNPRNSASVGNGVYRSLDGGRTWAHKGLEFTEKIHRLIVHPADPDTAWAAALGTSWGENTERGVFKTTDGGESWERVLYVDERTGCADLVVDPSNPDRLVAAMWDHRRDPWFFRSGGPGSGLWVTLDGGATWTQRGTQDGLPGGDLGRMGLGFCRAHPNVLYALVEAQTNVLLRSDDGGFSFQTARRDNDVANRPFYYADIRVDPQDPDRVYNLASSVTVSDDGGKSFTTLVPRSVHPDHHAMWIDPRDPNYIVEGNDGGLAISRTRGATWRFVRNLPLAQYYHINVDMETPYNVYGGMQDNGSWRGPSEVWENGGIRNHHWEEVGFGDGFATIPMPDDSQRGYAMSQGGALMRWNNVTGERKGIRPDGPEGVELRFNWNAGIAVGPSDPASVYYGSQFLHHSTDRGESWTTISPDLTTDNPEWQKQDESGGLTLDVTAAENYCSILTIAPSTLEDGVIWVGTDDGRLHVTRDGGGTWTSLEERLLGAPRNTWIPHVEASKHDAATAYVVLDDHRRANWQPFVYKTTDFGKTWTDLATPEIYGYVHVLEEDPVDARLLFLGTEFGMYVSRDGGKSWAKWTHGLPTCPVLGLHVHPRDHDLVIGTFGRSAYVLDDIRPLRAAPDGEDAGGLRISDIPDAVQYRTKQTGEARFPGSEEFRGENRPRGARISVYVPAGDDDEKKLDDAIVSIVDPAGEVIRRMEQSVQPGWNRFGWDMRHTGFRGGFGRRFGGGGGGGGGPRSSLDLPGGPEVLPGTYTVRVELGEQSAEKPLQILADPRVDVPLEARTAKIAAIRRAGALTELYAQATERIDRVREDVTYVRKRADADKDPDAAKGAAHPHAALIEAADALTKALDAADDQFRAPADSKGIDRRGRAGSKVRGLTFGLGSSWDAPTPAEVRGIDEAAKALREAIDGLNEVLGQELEAFRAALTGSGISILSDAGPLEVF